MDISKKRGRKKKDNLNDNSLSTGSVDAINGISSGACGAADITDLKKEVIKKSNKSGGGGGSVSTKQKLHNNSLVLIQEKHEIVSNGPNVILHLKCKMSELMEYQKMIKSFNCGEPDKIFDYEPSIPPSIKSYECETQNYSLYENGSGGGSTTPGGNGVGVTIPTLADDSIIRDIKSDNTNNILNKLKDLKFQLFNGTQGNKNSACFWCSYEFNTSPFYIPKHKLNDVVYCYGCFCTPECAVSHLMKERIDDSTRFERYYLLNYIYASIYNYKRNIKPAPNPYYSLDKYYGNLSIDEYRTLLKTEHLFVVIDKPMTRIYPEIHEEYEESLMGYSCSNHSGVSNNGNLNRVYKVKMQNENIPVVNNNIFSVKKK